jgi:rhodanese-related sulfurtransferase
MRPGPITVEELLAAARAGIERFTPEQTLEAMRSGSILIDIRPPDQLRRDGFVPGARLVPRNVVEWRLDPGGEHRDPDLARLDVPVIVICDEGYQSSLVAATLRRFGLDSGDVIGGVQAWRSERLPLSRRPSPSAGWRPSGPDPRPSGSRL